MATVERAGSANARKLLMIPEDIITDILLRLDLKTLLRFKSVCKTWYSLIRSRYFVSMYDNFGTVSQLLICTKGRLQKEEPNNYVLSFLSNDKFGCVLPDLEISSSRRDISIDFVRSCNGIVSYYDDSVSSFFWINPATGESRRLPPLPLGMPFLRVAFGFDDSQKIYDFKLLCMFGGVDGDDLLPTAQMFTLSSSIWRQIDLGLDHPIIGLRNVDESGTFCANSFHFMAHVLTYEGVFQRVILCCDINKERFTTIGIPLLEYRVALPSLTMYKEYVSLFAFTTPSSRGREWRTLLDIWIMKDYGVKESWTKLYRIQPYNKPLSSFLYAQPLYFWMDGAAVLLYKHHERELVSFRLDTLDVELIKKDDPSLQVVPYKETLTSIGINQIKTTQ